MLTEPVDLKLVGLCPVNEMLIPTVHEMKAELMVCTHSYIFSLIV